MKIMASIIMPILCTFTLLNGPVAMASAEEGADWDTIYDKDWNVQGYIKPGQFVSDQYYLYDKDWNRKGYIKRNRFTGRYEIYDEKWNRKGYLEQPKDIRKNGLWK
jgi:hypothetical protein